LDYKAIIDKYYPDDDELRQLLLLHSRQVADLCLSCCDRHPELQLDRAFVEEAAMLHDIGIRWCHAPGIYCMGDEPYLLHGLIGGRVLREEGFPRHARVCERHTGAGITRRQIEERHLPLPLDDYLPETPEEQLVCYADKFFSKSHPERVLTPEQAANSLERFGSDGVERFRQWHELFG
jgi:uncharacterized protein